MAVRLHGIAGARPTGSTSPAAPTPSPEPRAVTPVPTKPARRRTPWTLGRVIYLLALAIAVGFGGRWLVLTSLFATATGFADRDIDRLAPRERGRITRVAVRPGDRVRQGTPMVWLDFALPEPAGAGNFASDALVRQASLQEQVDRLKERRLAVQRDRATEQATVAGLRSRVGALTREREMLSSWLASVTRLFRSGAATQAELAQVELRFAEADRAQSEAAAQIADRERALAALTQEVDEITRTLQTQVQGPQGNPDPGVLLASRDGIVGSVLHNAGEVVGPSDAVVVLVDEGGLRIRAYVSPKDAASFAVDRRVQVEFPTGERLEGKVSRLDMLASAAVVEPSGPPAPGHAPAPATARPVDPDATFLLAEIEMSSVAPQLTARLPVGSPCEVRAWRNLWVRR